MNILIVDDHRDWRQVLIAFLRRGLGQAVEISFHEAGTLKEAREFIQKFAREGTRAITLLDLHLPDSSLDKTLLAIDEFNPPVIVTSAEDDKDIQIRAMAAGAWAYFAKSDFEELGKTVARARLRDMNQKDRTAKTP